MLPMFKHPEEVKNFIEYVNKRVKVSLLFETNEAYHFVDDILKIDGIDEAHIGLNDLHLSMGLDFLYELMVYGQVEHLANKFKQYKFPFGVGGVGKMNEGDLKGEIIIREHPPESIVSPADSPWHSPRVLTLSLGFLNRNTFYLHYSCPPS